MNKAIILIYVGLKTILVNITNKRIFNITTSVIYSFFTNPRAISRAAEASILLSYSLVTVVVNRIGVSLILPRVELSILYQDEVKSEVLAASLDITQT